MRQNRTLQKAVSALLVTTLLVGVTGCYGSFAVTQKVHQFNDEVSDNEWFEEVVFLVFAALPVYGLAITIDALIVNSIEFWTGETPMGGAAGDGAAGDGAAGG